MTMLQKDKITKFAMMSNEWHSGRLGKFTSSEIYNLMKPEGIGVGGLSYIYRKVGERLSGRPAKDDILTAATAHGNEYEIEALRQFVKEKKIQSVDGKVPILTQRLIVADEMTGSTPDGIWLVTENAEKTAWVDARVIECKCPYSYDGYVKLKLCKTPAEVKKCEPKYYYQILDQMLVCDVLLGYLVIFQPFFKEGGLNIIEFKKAQKEGDKFPIADELKIMNTRKLEAISIFDKTIKELSQ